MCDSLLAQFKLSPRHPPQMLVGCSPIPYSLQLFLACKSRLPPKFPSDSGHTNAMPLFYFLPVSAPK